MEQWIEQKPMMNLSQQQRAEAERLFSQGLRAAQNHEYASAAAYYQKAADLGHPGAQNNLGNLYRRGDGTPQDQEKAFQLYYQSAQCGNVVAMRNLADCYERGQGTTSAPDQTVLWLSRAADRKDILACKKLAEFYGNYRHRDEEKMRFWYQKGGELGDANSWFQLGRLCTRNHDGDCSRLAVEYYDRAAACGDFKMKLQVAKALDAAEWGQSQALDLEKAKKWYTEISYCEDERLQLEAAEGLAELTDHSGTPIRPALDSTRAYMVFRTLAMKGNRRACKLAAYCSECGKGTVPNIDIAVLLYEQAGEPDRAAWCRKKKQGDMVYHPHERQKQLGMPPAEKTVHTDQTEYYLKGRYSHQSCEYSGHVYYIHREYEHPTYLCSSDLAGEDIRILAQVPDDYGYATLHVNVTGIYLYYLREEEFLSVRHLDFHGTLLHESRVETETEHIDCVSFYDNQMYYVLNEEETDPDSRDKILCLDVDTGTVLELYHKAKYIYRLFALGEQLVFRAKYENSDCDTVWEEGWMILNLASGTTECLSNPYCSLENVVDAPYLYDEEDPRYHGQSTFDRNVVSLDFSRGIFWTEHRELEGPDSGHLKTVRYWEPRALWGNRDEVLSHLPIWRMPDDLTSSCYGYFDGVHLYYSDHYATFRAGDANGASYLWSEGNFGHGECDRFRIMGDYLFLNVAAFGEEQYPLSLEKVNPIRKSWFHSPLPQDVIARYQGNDTRADAAKEKEDLFDLPSFPPDSEPAVGNEVPDVTFSYSKKQNVDVPASPPSVFPEKLQTAAPAGGDLKLCDFRAMVAQFTGARETLLRYRKSLENKWDYNAFVGILMSIKGPRFQHQGCMNLAIGQGDNSKSTETRLMEQGLMGLYNQYKGKNYDQRVTVKEVEDAIVAIVPEYQSIRAFFDQAVLTPMSTGSRPVPEAAPSVSQPPMAFPQETCGRDMAIKKVISETDIKYNICTFGAKFHIGFGVPVTIRMKDQDYSFKTHNKVKGRIDGMKKLYSENYITLGTTLWAEYSDETHTISLAILL